jgi:hypothetical protein
MRGSKINPIKFINRNWKCSCLSYGWMTSLRYAFKELAQYSLSILTLGTLAFSFSNSAMADYYQVIDKGQTYGYIYQEKKSDRADSVNNFLNSASAEIREMIINTDGDFYYNPTNGDAGTLVAVLGFKNLLVLNVQGNYVLIDKKAVKKIDSVAYKNYAADISVVAAETFGFKLGVTTQEDAVKILNMNGAIYKTDLFYKGYQELPVIDIKDYKYFPEFTNAASNEKLKPYDEPHKPHQIERASLSFIDNKLYQIKIFWRANGKDYFDSEHFNSDVVGKISDGLSNKYKREKSYGSRRVNGTTDVLINYYWLNPQRHIVFETFVTPIIAATRSEGTTACTLAYNDSRLLEKANSLKKTIDGLEEAKNKEVIQKNKQEEIEVISKQL